MGSIPRTILPFVAALTLFACSGGDDAPVVSQSAARQSTSNLHIAAAADVGSDLFQPAVFNDTGSNPEAVAIGDVNGDGRNDVVMVTSEAFDSSSDNDFSLLVWIQNPDGTLAPPVKYFLGGVPHSVAIGDVNGDGRADVVVAIGTGIGVLAQNAGGTLDPMVLYPTRDSRVVRVADLNNDGRLDIVGAGIETGTVTVFTQNSDGTLAAPVTYSFSMPGMGSAGDDLKVGDVNNDRLTDVVVTTSFSALTPGVSILYQQPDGTFGGLTSLPTPPLTTWAIGVGDVNGDGLNDIVVSVDGGGNKGVITFLQNRDGTMGPPTNLLPSAGYLTAVEVADVNGDGLADVVAYGYSGLSVYLQQADGTLGPEQLYPIQFTETGPHGLAVGDINGDGVNDVVIANSNRGLVIFLGRGAPVR